MIKKYNLIHTAIQNRVQAFKSISERNFNSKKKDAEFEFESDENHFRKRQQRTK